MEEKNETVYTGKMKTEFPFFGVTCGIYAIFYTFCLYRNLSGITLPFFIAGSLLFCFLCMRRLGISLKKDTAFYSVSLILLGISSFCTSDGTLLFFNGTGIFLLFLCLWIHQFYQDREWGFGKYAGTVFRAAFGAVGCIVRPFTDGAAWNRMRPGKERKKKREGTGKIKYILLGLLIACPFILIIGGLLISSDAVICDMVQRMFARLHFWSYEFWDDCFSKFRDGGLMAGMAIGMFLFSYGLCAYLGKGTIREETEKKDTGEPAVMITVTGILTLMYLFYSGVQIVSLFFGALPEGYTYAQYAREGFFQLLAVCIINLLLVLFSIRYFRESRVLRIILTVMSACTYVMIASSALRMIMYIRFFYLTYLRILVLWALAVLAVLLAGLLVTIYRRKFRLFRYSMIAVTVFYLALSFAHPDYWIAKVNSANTESVRSGFFLGEPYEDYEYLCTLSEDAAPFVQPVLEDPTASFPFKEYWKERYSGENDRTSLRKLNLSKYFAYRIRKG